MENADVLVIGAGVVGLSVARLLSENRTVVVVEKHDSFGRETSSRNSEVIHAGFYYPAESLKARLCVRGNPLLYEYCNKNGVPCRMVGKIVIGNSDAEIAKIHQLFEQGKKNGVPGLTMLDRAGIAKLEPSVRGSAGLFSPSTGIFDTHSLMKSFARDAARNGATIAYGCEAMTLRREGDGFAAGIRDTDDEVFTIGVPIVVNAAGLWADTAAESAGIDVESAGYRIHPCKGEYFSVNTRHRGRLNHLVYPAPTPISLGVHAVLGLDGSLKLGPNAFFVESKSEYSVDPAHGAEFEESAREFLPFIEPGDLSPDMSGIRPKLQHGSETFHDFVIRDEADRGLPGLINLIGIESPGLTSCMAIAEMVRDLIATL